MLSPCVAKVGTAMKNGREAPPGYMRLIPSRPRQHV